MKKILVTGADGFIGSHLTEKLVCCGYSVRPFVMYNSTNSWGWLEASPPEVKKELDVFAGDIRDPNGLREAMKGCSQVIHLAALIAIPYSYHSPDTYIDTNIKGTLNVLQAARDLNVDKVLHTSTSEVYGTARFVPISEDHPLQGQSPYSASKIGADHLAFSFFSSFQLPVTIVRPFNTYGPRQSARAIIPSVITQLLSGANSLSLGSLSPTRDFNYIADTISGFLAVLKGSDTEGQVLNLGSNFEVSIFDTVQLIARIMETDITILTDQQRVRPENSEVNRLWADNTKIKKITGWEPEYSGLGGFEIGLRKTIEWLRDPSNLRLYKPERYNI
ncbi:MAG: SDR family oxidoreductase [Bdellovibrionales bacterium]|nr:SDR family oxidoreductase [Bdellovibrionales bacterium]